VNSRIRQGWLHEANRLKRCIDATPAPDADDEDALRRVGGLVLRRKALIASLFLPQCEEGVGSHGCGMCEPCSYHQSDAEALRAGEMNTKMMTLRAGLEWLAGRRE
jgi:hypothetical protein